MAKVVCNRDKNEYLLADGRTCCARCPAGKYVQRVCDATRATECAECGRELFTETMNFLHKCITCRQCHTPQRQVKACLAHENTQCECIPGFYCPQPGCEQCIPVTPCPVGQGVKVKATATNDTVCALCESGTFSNVSDHTSPCQTHSSCTDQGKVMSGTHSVDAICGPVKSGCSWELPAGLWSGLVLSSLLIVLLALIFWRKKHKSRKTDGLSDVCPPGLAGGSVGLPVACLNPPESATPLTTLTDIHCQESCGLCTDITVDCNCHVLDSTGQGLDTTHSEPTRDPDPAHCEAKATSGTPENPEETSVCFRAEPEEDEWCGK